MPYPFNNDGSHKNWQNVVIEFCVYEEMATHRKSLKVLFELRRFPRSISDTSSILVPSSLKYNVYTCIPTTYVDGIPKALGQNGRFSMQMTSPWWMQHLQCILFIFTCREADWNSKSFPIPKLCILDQFRKKTILLYSICNGRNCDLVQLAIVKTYTPHLAFVLLQITSLHLYWWTLQSYESIPPSVGPTLPHSLPASCNYSLCQLLLYCESQTYSLTDWVTHTHPPNYSLTQTLTDLITNSRQLGIHTGDLSRRSSVIASVPRPWYQLVLLLYQRVCNVQKEVSIC